MLRARLGWRLCVRRCAPHNGRHQGNGQHGHVECDVGGAATDGRRYRHIAAVRRAVHAAGVVRHTEVAHFDGQLHGARTVNGAIVVDGHASIGGIRAGSQDRRRGRCVGQLAVAVRAVLALAPAGRELQLVAAAVRTDGAHRALGGRCQTVDDVPIGGDAAANCGVALLRTTYMCKLVGVIRRSSWALAMLT